MSIPTGVDPTQLGAADLARTFAAGQLRAQDIVEAHIARLQQAHAQCNVVVCERYELALREAREADARRAAGDRLPVLAGVPITLKECIDLAGTPSTFGVERFRAPVTRTASAVERLRRAGAIVLAKTNVAQLLSYLETSNPVFGRTSHPRSPERSSGGSSGGEAVAVAMHGSPLGIGTDIGGSVRLPAAFCGVVGFKPTAGRVPDEGRHSSAPPGQRAIVSQVGVIARSVEDAALGLRVAIGDGDDHRGPLLPHDAIAVRGLRVVVLEDDGILTPCPAARRAVREASLALEGAGAQLVQVALPPRVQLQALFWAILGADRAAHARATIGKTRVDPILKQMFDGMLVPRRVLEGLLLATHRRKARDVARAFFDGSADAYFRAAHELEDVRAKAAAAMRDADVVLSPGAALPAVRHGATAELSLIGSYTAAYNALGWPAGVIPWTEVRAGEESDRPASKDPFERAARESERDSVGLPIAVQIAAPPHHDHVALGVLRALETLRT